MNQHSEEFSQIARDKSPMSQAGKFSASGHDIYQSKQLLQNMSLNPSRTQLKNDVTLVSDNSHLYLGGLDKESNTNFRYGK